MGGWSGSMGALVRVNGGIEKGQWGHWSGRWSGSMGCIEKGQWVLVRVGVNGGIRPNEVLKRVNGGVGQGQWRHGVASSTLQL